MKTPRLTLFLLLMLIPAGWAKQLDQDKSKDQLVRDAVRALRGAKQLSFIATVTVTDSKVPSRAPEVIVCDVIHGSDNAADVVISQQGLKIYEIHVRAIPGGKIHISEYNSVDNEKENYTISVAEFAHDVWNARCRGHFDFCRLSCAGYAHSWVGPESHRALFLSEQLPLGTLQRRETVNGKYCDVLLVELTSKETGRQARQVFYFSRRTHLLMRLVRDVNGVLTDTKIVYR